MKRDQVIAVTSVIVVVEVALPHKGKKPYKSKSGKVVRPKSKGKKRKR